MKTREWCALKVALQSLLAVVLLWGLIVGSANAIITAQFKAQATIVAGCAVLGTGSLFGTLSFGTYPGTGTGGVNGTFVQNTSLTLACTPGVTLNMAINGGSNFTTVRNVMQSGNSLQLPYRIYTDAAHTNEIIVNQNVPLNISSSNNNIICRFTAYYNLTALALQGATPIH